MELIGRRVKVGLHGEEGIFLQFLPSSRVNEGPLAVYETEGGKIKYCKVDEVIFFQHAQFFPMHSIS